MVSIAGLEQFVSLKNRVQRFKNLISKKCDKSEIQRLANFQINRKINVMVRSSLLRIEHLKKVGLRVLSDISVS